MPWTYAAGWVAFAEIVMLSGSIGGRRPFELYHFSGELLGCALVGYCLALLSWRMGMHKRY